MRELVCGPCATAISARPTARLNPLGIDMNTGTGILSEPDQDCHPDPALTKTRRFKERRIMADSSVSKRIVAYKFRLFPNRNQQRELAIMLETEAV